jgi:hypothetical protein
MLEEFLFNYNKGYHLEVLKKLDNFKESALIHAKFNLGEFNYYSPSIDFHKLVLNLRKFNNYKRSGKQC